ncbi:unnamed protein product [Thelazia callipaeda]|uniref:Protein kinase domain-containing protein n=1 Tax=Thelazia callipaeda TaxID=103827 RepID=A0A0N5D277_THECL|nr:unnamed protein product [Thelazia callipaeda]
MDIAGSTSSHPEVSSNTHHNIAVSRKRPAACRLPRITLNAINASRSDLMSDLANNELSQENNGDDAKRRLLDVKISPTSKFASPELGGARFLVLFQSWSKINDRVVCGYRLIGAGKEFVAYHVEKKIVKTCEIINGEQYVKLLVVANRLNEAERYWKYGDLETMREFVLPSGTEVFVGENGQRFMFSNWQYGTMHSKVQMSEIRNEVRLSESEAFALFSKIARGMAFCHACGIIIRDVKLRKFVFTDKQMQVFSVFEENVILVITSEHFCISSLLKNFRTQLRLRDVFDVVVCEDITNDWLHDRHICPAYVAPEILKDSAAYAGRPADIWALGILLYVLLFGCYPFIDTTLRELFYRILRAKFSIPTHIRISPIVRTLIFGMLRKEPLERPKAEQLLHIPCDDQYLSESSDQFFRCFLSGWLDAPSSRIPSVFGIFGNPTLELARHMTKVRDENDDQVVPTFSSAVHNVKQHLQIMRDVTMEPILNLVSNEGSEESLTPAVSTTISTAVDNLIGI